MLLYRRLSGTGNPGRPPRLSHSSWALFFNVALRPQRLYGLIIRDEEPRTSTCPSHSSCVLFFNVALRSQRHYGLLGSSPLSFTQLLGSVLQCCFTFTKTVRTIRDMESRTSTSSFTQLLGSVLQCCFMSTERVRTIRDGITISSLTQLLSSDFALLLLSWCFTSTETKRPVRDGTLRVVCRMPFITWHLRITVNFRSSTLFLHFQRNRV